MNSVLKSILVIILVCLFIMLPTAAAQAASGTYDIAIGLSNQSADNVYMWIGHGKPQDQKEYATPGGILLKYAGLRYTKTDPLNNYYYDDNLLVNAMKFGDFSPYPTLVSQTFAIKGYVSTIAVVYTNDGTLELKVTYAESLETPTAAPATTPTTTPTLEDSGVRFSGLNGQVELADGDGKNPHLAKLNTIIPVYGRIIVDEDSSCILSFADMSTFVLKGPAEIIVSKPPEKDSKVSLVRGAIWANVKKVFREGSMDIEMNQAVAGIKGTTFILEQNEDGSSVLKVIEGMVEYTSKAYGAVVTLTDGQTITGTRDGFGRIETFDVAAETGAWDALRAKTEAATPIADTPVDALATLLRDGSSFPVIPVVIGAGVVVIVLIGIGIARSGKKKQR